MGNDIFPQTTVDQFPAAAFAGQLYDPSQADVMSAIVSESGGVEAGVAVILDTAQASLLPGYGFKAKLPVDANSVVFGFTLLNVMKEPRSPRFAVKDSVACIRKGRIWCLVQNTVAQGDDVYAWYSTGSTKGSIRNDAGSTQAVKVRGCKVLIGASTGGVALVDCNLPLASADTVATPGGSWNVTPIKTGAYTAVLGDLVRVNPTAGTVAIALPTAVGAAGNAIKVVDYGADGSGASASHTITISPNGAEKIDGAASKTITPTPESSRSFLTARAGSARRPPDVPLPRVTLRHAEENGRVHRTCWRAGHDGRVRRGVHRHPAHGQNIKGRSIVVQEDANSTTAVTVATSLTQTINGASTKSLTTAYGRTTFTSDGSNWTAA
jgi:hypothetical protein